MIVQEAYQNAMNDAKKQNKQDVVEKSFTPMSTNDQWSELMKPGGSQLISDPLQEDDIYATVPKDTSNDVSPLYTQTNYEETDMNDDINSLLDQSFTHEKRRSSFVQNVPQLIQKKKQDNYGKLFNGVSAADINSMEI